MPRATCGLSASPGATTRAALVRSTHATAPMRRTLLALSFSVLLIACGGPGWRGEPTTDEFLTADEYLEREAANDGASDTQPASQTTSQPSTQPATQPASQPTPTP